MTADSKQFALAQGLKVEPFPSARVGPAGLGSVLVEDCSQPKEVARLKGEVQAEVTSARPLSDSETASLKAVLKSGLGREPRLETKVDPALLGGLVVKLGSRMIDSSIRTKLLGLRAAMRGN